MSENRESVVVSEYSDNRSAPLQLSEADLKYLEGDIFNPTKNKNFKIGRSREQEGYFIENSSYAGVIQLSESRIIFSTKVKTNLFYLLSYLKSETEFLFDSNIVIDIKDGSNFFDIIGRLFVNELSEILRRGILKSYVTKAEDLRFLKGKLNIRRQMHNHVAGSTGIACTYSDLTYDNLENRIVLRALNELIQLIRFSESLREDAIAAEYALKDLVSLVDVSPNDCDRVHISRINERYETIIKLSRAILEEQFIRSTEKGPTRGFNFIVNMNKVFEDFVTELVKEVVAEQPELKDYEVVDQMPFRTLDQEGKLKIVPDIILKHKYLAETYPIIIDTKYKKQDANNDYYQLISYALAIPNSCICCLIYPKDFITEQGLHINRNILKPDKTITILATGLDLYSDEELSFKDFIKRAKVQLYENILAKCLSHVKDCFPQAK